MSLLVLFVSFGFVIALVIALPVLNGIGTYQRNIDGRKQASQLLEEKEREKKRYQAGLSSSASTATTTASNRRAGTSGGFEEYVPFGEQPSPSPYAPSVDDVVEPASTAGGSGASSAAAAAAAAAAALTDGTKLAALKTKLLNKHNPLKFTPKTGGLATTTSGSGVLLDPTAPVGSVDVTKPFNRDINNEFDYDAFIQDAEREDAVDEEREQSRLQRVAEAAKQDEQAREKLAREHLESLA
ncbi:hypothetical protein D0Z00_004080 [Geotrichum galactomycetum]|uniref:Uncharacterized protein n=1 Tax=Geotrichum galactomycetum TaxID=27317 RepID=A0ACB6UZF3_9ASCO|nr:hypothetical protein D0Z00_004080 [Geotrichum candidum]